MQFETFLKKILLTITLLGLVVLVSVIFYFSIKNITRPNSSFLVLSNAATDGDIIPGLPVRLKIPKINLDVQIEYVGIDSKGAIAAPKIQENVAWFNLSPYPGKIGSAIITGHYGWKNKRPAVFDNLYKLHQGDKIYIEDNGGLIMSFVVKGNRRYDPMADATDILISKDGKAHLNLITCEGDWDAVAKSYSQRLVIFTDKE